jgi:hypothetical protein
VIIGLLVKYWFLVVPIAALATAITLVVRHVKQREAEEARACVVFQVVDYACRRQWFGEDSTP